jgi:KDO2-lipid IV(A) lauroyltransferase
VKYLFVGLMRWLSRMPLKGIRVLGHGLGLLLWAFLSNRRHIVQTNLTLCFAEKSNREIEQLTRAHFVQFAQSLLDRSWLWHAPLQLLESRLKWVGTAAAFSQLDADGRKIILAPHFVGLDAGGMALTLRANKPVAFIFVPQHNKVMDEWVTEGRQRTGNVKP